MLLKQVGPLLLSRQRSIAGDLKVLISFNGNMWTGWVAESVKDEFKWLNNAILLLECLQIIVEIGDFFHKYQVIY